MNLDSKIKLLTSNIEKLEKILEDLNDNVEIKRDKIKYLKEQIAANVKKIDQIIDKYNADS